MLSDIIDLMRLKNPTGFLLLYFPCVFGLFLASSDFVDLWYLALFLFGSIMMRGAGCIVNDIVDHEIDQQVARTKNRPIASGRVSVEQAVYLLIILLLLCLPILFFLSASAILIALCSLFLVTLYPFMKRITYWPQAFLGITFNIGVLIAYATIAGTLDLIAIVAYIGCIFWTLGYDTIYGFMDIEDDQKIGVKSSAIFLQDKNYKLWIGSFYVAFTALMVISMTMSVGYDQRIVVYSLLPLMALLCQVYVLDISSSANCLARFKSNIYVGLLWIVPLGITMCNNIFID